MWNVEEFSLDLIQGLLYTHLRIPVWLSFRHLIFQRSLFLFEVVSLLPFSDWAFFFNSSPASIASMVVLKYLASLSSTVKSKASASLCSKLESISLGKFLGSASALEWVKCLLSEKLFVSSAADLVIFLFSFSIRCLGILSSIDDFWFSHCVRSDLVTRHQKHFITRHRFR